MKRLVMLALMLMAALCTSLVFGQETASIEGVCRDRQGDPIVGAVVEFDSAETGRKYDLKTNTRGKYYSLGIVPGKYRVTLLKDGQQLFSFNNFAVQPQAEANVLDFDLKKEAADQAQATGISPEELKRRQQAADQAAPEGNTVKQLNEKLVAARTAQAAGDFETAIRLLEEANQLDSSRDLVWATLGGAYSALAASRPEADSKAIFLKAAEAYETAIRLKPGQAAYFGNYAIALGKAGKTDEARAATATAVQLDPANAPRYYLNLGVMLVKAGQARPALEALAKVPESDKGHAGARWLISVATVEVYLDSVHRKFQDLKAEQVMTDADTRKAFARADMSAAEIPHFTIWNSNLTVPGGSCSIEYREGEDPWLECAFNDAANVDELRSGYDSLVAMVNQAIAPNAAEWTSREETLPPSEGLKHVFKIPGTEVAVEVYHRAGQGQVLGRSAYAASLTVKAVKMPPPGSRFLEACNAWYDDPGNARFRARDVEAYCTCLSTQFRFLMTPEQEAYYAADFGGRFRNQIAQPHSTDPAWGRLHPAAVRCMQ